MIIFYKIYCSLIYSYSFSISRGKNNNDSVVILYLVIDDNLINLPRVDYSFVICKNWS